MDADRREKIQGWATERYLATDEHREIYSSDALTRLQLQRLIQMTSATDEAMRLEGVDEPSRDRVIYRVLYGDEPDTSYEAPDFSGAANRMQDRMDALKYMATRPLTRHGGMP